jgi:hypothetical protein
MFGMIRNIAVIGVIAYCSPVHEDTPEARLARLAAAPALLMGGAAQAGPGLALQAVNALDPASREALARKIAEVALEEAGAMARQTLR